jgi:hypothetical protein
MPAKQTIAFLGATGGIGSACLAHALRAGHHCTARTPPFHLIHRQKPTDQHEPVVRTPSKLHFVLTNDHQISASNLDRLVISAGDAKNPEDVAKALIHPAHPGRLVDIIFFGVGAYVVPQFSLTQPLVLPAADANITQDCMRALFSAIDNMPATTATVKPLLIIISATAGKDVWSSVPWPWICAPLYTWLLRAPQMDKLAMEEIVMGDEGRHVRDYVVIRPAILTNGAERGVEKVRAGWTWTMEANMGVEREEAPGLAVGWAIGRRDVGRWVYEKVVRTDGEALEEKCVSLCY